MNTRTNHHQRAVSVMATSLLAILFFLSTGCSGEQPSTPEPIAAVTEPEASGIDGEGIYQKTCKVCHDAGIANAPNRAIVLPGHLASKRAMMLCSNPSRTDSTPCLQKAHA